MSTPEKKIPYQITVPIGTELNAGYHEDSDSNVVLKPTTLLVIEEKQNGALPVRLIEDGNLGEEILYYHQPEPKIHR